MKERNDKKYQWHKKNQPCSRQNQLTYYVRLHQVISAHFDLSKIYDIGKDASQIRWVDSIPLNTVLYRHI